MFRTKQEYEAVTAYVEKEDITGCTALFDAAIEGNVTTVRSLLLERWAPKLGDFYRDHDGNWWFKTIGKGNKETN